MNIYRFVCSAFIVFLTSCTPQNIEPGTVKPNAVISKRQPAKTNHNQNKTACTKPVEFSRQVTLGYQGWFAAKGDGISNQWHHWSPYNETPTINNIQFELYPDVSEYHPDDLFPTKLPKLKNGQPAKLFSSARAGVVDLHFKWMKQYGLDGIALQRFSSELWHGGHKKHRNKVTELVKKSAEKYCRTFYIMYDLTGTNRSNMVKIVKQDWNRVLDKTLQVSESNQYARSQGKPVIGLWGLGFNSPAHNFTKQQASELIQWFKNKGFYVVGGVPYNFRLSKQDSRAKWSNVYKQFDMLLPWSVGRYREKKELAHHFRTIWSRDLAFIQRNRQAMKRVIFPGFSWSNWKKGRKNQIPRKRGDLFWNQAYLANQLGLGVYIAMFDEYDEGTAIAKSATTPDLTPSNQYFLTWDADGYALSSDYYLRLAGKITQMIHRDNQHYFSRSIPISNQVQDDASGM